MIKVARVLPDTVASELGIVPGTALMTVNGRKLEDFLDWEFLTADDELVLEVSTPDGEEVVYEIERPEGMAMGIVLEPPRVRRCANKCEFCFIEGLPKGLRTPLYVRDDDYRLSFAYGNFATLSNVKDKDIARILEYRLSPLYISVHATPYEARKILLNNPKVPDIMKQLSRLAEGGIQFHCQMVIVPGLNDGEVLEQSIADLWSLGEAVLSMAVVPVGLTQFSHLYTGEPMNAERANELHCARRAVGGAGTSRARTIAGCSARTSCTCSRGASCRVRSITEISRRSRMAWARSRILRQPRRRGRERAAAPRRTPHRHRHRHRDGRAPHGGADREAGGAPRARTSSRSSPRIRCSAPPPPRRGCSWVRTSSACCTDAPIWISRSFRRRPSTMMGSFSMICPSPRLREELSIPLVPSYDFLDVLSSEDLSDAASHLHTASVA